MIAFTCVDDRVAACDAEGVKNNTIAMKTTLDFLIMAKNYVDNSQYRVHKTRYQEPLAEPIGVSPYNMKHALITGCLCFMIFDHAQGFLPWV